MGMSGSIVLFVTETVYTNIFFIKLRGGGNIIKANDFHGLIFLICVKVFS